MARRHWQRNSLSTRRASSPRMPIPRMGRMWSRRCIAIRYQRSLGGACCFLCGHPAASLRAPSGSGPTWQTVPHRSHRQPDLLPSLCVSGTLLDRERAGGVALWQVETSPLLDGECSVRFRPEAGLVCASTLVSSERNGGKVDQSPHLLLCNEGIKSVSACKGRRPTRSVVLPLAPPAVSPHQI